MKELVSTFVVGALGITCWILAWIWICWWPSTQISIWAWVVDIWHPSAMPLVLSVWYWILPVMSTVGWAACALHQLILGEDQPKNWFKLNLVLWMPAWLYPTVALLLLGLGLVGILGMFVQHDKEE